jgi:hypothetical protein
VAAGLWTVVTPTYWSDGGDFGAAGLLLPRLGEPARPLPDAERLQIGAQGYVSLAALERLRAGSTAPSTAVAH